ncbi:MAG: PAS domain S-box protein, partial [Candidatus Thorarchaeota archaeon]
MDESEDQIPLEILNQFKILTNFPGPVSIKTHDSRLLFVNSFLKEFLKTDDWKNKTPHELYNPDFAIGVFETDKRVLSEGAIEVEQSTPDNKGVLRNLRTFKFPIKGEDGSIFIGTLSVDITELVRAREAISETEIKFRGAFEDAATGMALISLQGELLRVNTALCKMLGYSESELMEIGLKGVSHPDEYVPVLDNPQSFVDRGVNTFQFDKRYIHKNGHEILVFINSAIALDENSEPKYYVTQIQDITERKRLEDEVKDSEQKFRELFEQSNDPISIFSLDGEYIDANQRCLEMLGISREELISQPWQKRVVNSEHEHRGSIHEQLLNGETPKLYERTILRGDGTTVIVEVNVSLVRDEHGNPSYIQSIARDISERKETEMKLREIEKRKDLALEGGNLGVWDWIKETGEMTFDQRWYYILGYEEGDIETHVDGWTKLIHPDDIEAEYERWNAHVEGRTPGYSSEHRMKTKSGEWKWVLEKGRVVEWSEDGLTSRAAGTLQDITERKKFEIALRENEVRFRTLFEKSNDAIFILGLDGIILQCNQIAAKILGYTLEELIGESVYGIIDSEEIESAQRKSEEIKDMGIAPLYERIFVKKDGTQITLELNIVLVRDSDGNPEYLQSIARDITERKIAEAALREQEKEVRYTKDRAMLYLDLLGHDITNQLQAISAGTEIAQELANQDDVKKILDVVAQSIQRCERIIRTVKATEELRSVELQKVILADVITQTVDIIQENFPEVNFNVVIPSAEIIVRADQFLNVALSNLIDNAISHNPNKDKQVWIQLEESNAGYEIMISDNGEGIPDPVKEVLFDISQRFAGVGLHQTKEIMDKYGGCII